ncbi:hypothetical protein [uncultured Corynebacterium sp.]|uniref:hypothetical protein n=1 Tax=uncultured Corynebacterium sp. TaxID=159447 RepID=UPI0025DDA963|nr:hypothetical protein [uncultured Corynebacterium sp.]
MGLRSVIAKLTGPRAPRLATEDSGAPRVEVATLSVHTAEQMIILTIDPDTVPVIQEISHSGEAATVVHGSTAAHLRPTDRAETPVRDPKKGWIIPLSPPLRAAIAEQLTPSPDGYELSPQLAIIVEPAPDTTD